MQPAKSCQLLGHYGSDPRSTKKRRRTHTEAWTPQKRRHLERYFVDDPSFDTPDLRDCSQNHLAQLPSPTLTTSEHDYGNLEPSRAFCRKRKARSLDLGQPSKRARPLSKSASQTSPIDAWLESLPKTLDPVEIGNSLETMSRPPSKRTRSSGSLSGVMSQSGDGSETVASRDKKYSVYKDANYPTVLETKGSFMYPSKAGMLDEDRQMCERFLTVEQPIPDDILFDDDHFSAFHANLRGRSEARVCIDLHPRVMPSVENLAVCGYKEFDGLIDGHNDPWIKSVPFYGTRPQSDHMVGFKWSNFTAVQRQKLNIEPTKKSYYTAREDVYFPFLTGEVKCGKEALDLADRANCHSMTITLRGVVDVYRRASRAQDVHRRVLGFSISHDDNGARIYAHYPEVDGNETTFWRETLRELSFGNNRGQERWTCYRFTLNVYQMFALPLLQRLQRTIDTLPDPTSQSFGLNSALDNISVAPGLQDDVSELESQDEGVKRSGSRRGLSVDLRNMIQVLQRQLEQQRSDSEREKAEQQRQMAEQQKQSKEQLAVLEKQITEQSEQHKEHIKLLKELLNR